MNLEMQLFLWDFLEYTSILLSIFQVWIYFNISSWIYFSFNSLEYIPRRWIAESYGSSVLNFLRNLHTTDAVAASLYIYTLLPTVYKYPSFSTSSLVGFQFYANNHSDRCEIISLWIWFIYISMLVRGFPGGTRGKNLPANAGDIRDTSSVSGLGRSPGGRHGSPLQYSCLENPMDRGACWTTVHGVAKSWTQLSDWAVTQPCWLMILNIFSHICCPFVYLLWKNIYSSPLPILKSDFFFLLLVCRNSLYTLYINPLSNTWFENIFSHSVNCLFTLLTTWKAIDCFLYCTEAF